MKARKPRGLIQDIVKAPAPVVTIRRTAAVHDAARLMRDHHIGAVVVVEERGLLVGIVTERDLVNRVSADGGDAGELRVAQVMTPDPASCPIGTTMSDAQELMMSRGVRHLPVVDRQGRPAGVVSSRDVMARQVETDRAMRAAAEQVAKLSTCLKSLDFDEVVQMVTSRVPEIFQAARSVLFFPNNRDDDAGGGPLLVSRRRCACPDARLCARHASAEFGGNGKDVVVADVPPPCHRLGGESPAVTVSLEIAGLTGAAGAAPAASRGVLCMCGLPADVTALGDLLWYKGTLIREILNSNLTNARLYQQARHDSMTDMLTKVGSRRLFEAKLEAELARSRRYHRPFCVAMVDLDYFKLVNDRYGHAVGDEVLCQFAQALADEKRDSDVLARYGGDEFLLLMPETETPGALSAMERIRCRTESLVFPNGLTVTVSGGVVQFTPDGAVPAEKLVRFADLALYEAKRKGRNRILQWSGDTPEMQGQHVDQERIDELQLRLADVSARSKEVFVQSIWGLVQALEARDKYTKSHSENVMRYGVGLAETMGMRPGEVDVVRRAAMIHDIGKIGVPDNILRKAGPLTDDERLIMQQHPLIGVGILDQMRFLERELPIVRHHHERWDGTGYPDRLADTAIPLGARILAVADSFDAITSDRVYRRSRSINEALQILADEAGTQFDPNAVEAMLRWVESLVAKLPPGKEATPADLLGACEAAAA